MDDLGFVETADRLGESIVVAVADAADAGRAVTFRVCFAFEPQVPGHAEVDGDASIGCLGSDLYADTDPVIDGAPHTDC